MPICITVLWTRKQCIFRAFERKNCHFFVSFIAVFFPFLFLLWIFVCVCFSLHQKRFFFRSFFVTSFWNSLPHIFLIVTKLLLGRKKKTPWSAPVFFFFVEKSKIQLINKSKMLEQIPTVQQQPKKPCKNDRKTMLKKQALARYFYFSFIILHYF